MLKSFRRKGRPAQAGGPERSSVLSWINKLKLVRLLKKDRNDLQYEDFKVEDTAAWMSIGLTARIEKPASGLPAKIRAAFSHHKPSPSMQVLRPETTSLEAQRQDQRPSALRPAHDVRLTGHDDYSRNKLKYDQQYQGSGPDPATHHTAHQDQESSQPDMDPFEEAAKAKIDWSSSGFAQGNIGHSQGNAHEGLRRFLERLQHRRAERRATSTSIGKITNHGSDEPDEGHHQELLQALQHLSSHADNASLIPMLNDAIRDARRRVGETHTLDMNAPALDRLKLHLREILQQHSAQLDRSDGRVLRQSGHQKQSAVSECIVCGDQKARYSFPATASTEQCDHPPQVCKECLKTWVASELESKGTEGIKCPECPCILSYANIKLAASPATFQDYDRLATRTLLSSLPGFSWCLSPSCESGQINVRSEGFMNCQSCSYKQCVQHRAPWHQDETCKQYEKRTSTRAREEEAKTLAMLDKISKACPGKKCGWRIQKTDGCAHMTCRKCRHTFCWECLAPHAEIRRVGNTAHAPTCMFYSDHPNIAWPFSAHGGRT